ncbi:MAG: YkoF family thiamine/hydroxymethylpyrimidine-binding protein [Bacillota bacterium]|jgi:uncharacterized protein YqgV (UPF0045/DUF77 family)
MCAMEKIASCQISFLPIGSIDYFEEIGQVLGIIRDSGLEHDIGILSTVVRGEKSLVFQLIKDIYENMDNHCRFTMDIKISNLCGCEE